MKLATTALASLLAFAAPAARAVEEPAYTLVDTAGAIEIREYPALVVAEVTVSGPRGAAANDGFGPLADYIFGENRPGPKIAMTAPVLQERATEAGAGQTIAMTAPVLQEAADGADRWHVRFIMPAGATLDSLPAPTDPRVRLETWPAERRAVIRFSGFARESTLASKTAELDAYLASRGLAAEGPPIYAFYNPPWTLPFLRRNEVMRRLAP